MPIGEGQMDFGLRSAYTQLDKGGKNHPVLSEEEFRIMRLDHTSSMLR